MLRLFGFTRTLEELDEIDVPRHARAMEALGYGDAFKTYTRAEKLEGDELTRANEMLNQLPQDIRRNVEQGRRDLRRYGAKYG